jgi:hypothetical protein
MIANKNIAVKANEKPAYLPWIKVIAACGGFFCVMFIKG